VFIHSKILDDDNGLKIAGMSPILMVNLTISLPILDSVYLTGHQAEIYV
jgi:hypothetical protein